MTDPSPDARTQPAEPVTVVISRLVRPGREQDYEDWIRQVGDLLAGFEGSDGFTVLRPGEHHPGPEYVLVLRFDDEEAVQRWKRSEPRQRWIARLPELTIDTTAWEQQSGLETWFTLPGRAVPTGPPPRWKQALLTTFGLVPLLLVSDVTLGRLLGDLPAPLRIILITPLLVALMTWVLMPLITRAAYRWLYPGQRG